MPRQHSQPGSGDIWRRHAFEIRKLYRKNTLENVKCFMEKQRGFPEMAIPTWNEKLGKLGVRKNVTSEEWKKIYLHCLPRLEDPTRVKGDLKLKRTKLGTEVIVRGRKYNWDQAWKNMKSAKAIGQLLLPGESPSPLPPDVVIRSPQATSRGVLPVTSSVLPILPISNGNSQERAFATINTQETGLIRHGHVLAHQTKKDHGSGEAGAHVLFEHLDMRMILPMEEYSEVVRKLCLSGLPIYHVVSYTVGIFSSLLSLPGKSPSYRLSIRLLHPGTFSNLFL
ncbi:hypothetical protein F5883DRAFT_65600 [Diaporthe sp. PMI_573]|nr:hypothetical protein F5883DRAFT_65600 [Diaporthaceae sp. PMI_573]